MNEGAKQIIQAIIAKQNVQKALWLENYVKHNVKSFGVGIPEIREIVKQVEKDTKMSKSSTYAQVDFLNDLMSNDFTEPKLAAILFMQLYWKTKNGNNLLKMTANWFDNEWISDWNVCDWLCVRSLTPLLDNEPELVVPVLKEWNKSSNLWKSRASLVPFAQSKNIGSHTETILQFSSELIQRDERFCKTAVGWVLRQYSKVDSKLVTDFLEQKKEYTTKEMVKNATKYIEIKQGQRGNRPIGQKIIGQLENR